MDFGICVPNFRAGASPEGMLAAVETAERIGWRSAWTTDHVLIDDNERGADYRHIYEALNTLAWLAGRSDSISLGISVLVVPMRNAVVLAKELATIDALSHGRLIAGLGIGWNQAEFDNLGVGERFKVRGEFLEETVALWRYLWGGGQGPYEGRFDSFSEAYFSPLPPQGADLPIWIGATATKALQRAGRIAQGYQSSRATPDQMRERASVIKAAAEEARRPAPTISARASVTWGAPEDSADLLTGSSEEMIATVQAYADAGVTEMAIDLKETDPDAVSRKIERFHSEVVARFRD